MILPVILSGGAGKRLWPLSRPRHPKQFLALTDEKTLFRHTLDRVLGLPDLADPLVVCAAGHRAFVESEFEAAGLSGHVIFEPCGRNTAPAIELAAQAATKLYAPETILLVLPADHVISRPELFRAAVESALPLAQAGYLCTFGIVPSSPETGYGYIKQAQALKPAGYAVERFVEKPDLPTAEAYLRDGGYLWNSGIFLFRADCYQSALATCAPDISASLANVLTVSDDECKVDAQAFSACRSVSIDYAVFEKFNHVAVVPLDAPWSDVGSFDALQNLELSYHPNSLGNAIWGDGLILGGKNNAVYAPRRLVALSGVSDVIVVDSEDAVLVLKRGESQTVKTVVERLESLGRREANFSPYQTREHHVAPGQSFEICGSSTRTVTLQILQGKAMLEESQQQLSAGEVVQSNGNRLKLLNFTDVSLILLETQVSIDGEP